MAASPPVLGGAVHAGEATERRAEEPPVALAPRKGSSSGEGARGKGADRSHADRRHAREKGSGKETDRRQSVTDWYNEDRDHDSNSDTEEYTAEGLKKTLSDFFLNNNKPRSNGKTNTDVFSMDKNDHSDHDSETTALDDNSEKWKKHPDVEVPRHVDPPDVDRRRSLGDWYKDDSKLVRKDSVDLVLPAGTPRIRLDSPQRVDDLGRKARLSIEGF